MELKNYDELIPEIARLMMDHDMKHTRSDECIYLDVDDTGVGTVGSMYDADNSVDYIVCWLPECHTDWTSTFQEIYDIANVLGWTVNTLMNSTAAWISETTGDHMDEADVGYTDIESYINANPSLLDSIRKAEAKCFEDAFSDYVERATDELDELLQEVG